MHSSSQSCPFDGKEESKVAFAGHPLQTQVGIAPVIGVSPPSVCTKHVLLVLEEVELSEEDLVSVLEPLLAAEETGTLLEDSLFVEEERELVELLLRLEEIEVALDAVLPELFELEVFDELLEVFCCVAELATGEDELDIDN